MNSCPDVMHVKTTIKVNMSLSGRTLELACLVVLEGKCPGSVDAHFCYIRKKTVLINHNSDIKIDIKISKIL